MDAKGLDFYNQTETGDVAITLRAEGSANERIPCVKTFEHHPQDNRVNATEVNSTLGTFGNAIQGKDTLVAVAIAENIIGRKVENGGNGVGATEELAYTQNATGVMGVSTRSCVRRITPIEAERLMGFPDNYTRIPWNGKAEEECPDSHRYKCCGNSMSVNCMEWIGMRIEEVERRVRC